MTFFLSLLIEGGLAGAVYALIALAFVVVYKASRVVNLALGEWLMLASLLMALLITWPAKKPIDTAAQATKAMRSSRTRSDRRRACASVSWRRGAQSDTGP